MKTQKTNRILLAVQLAKSDHEQIKAIANLLRISISDLVRTSIFEKLHRENLLNKISTSQIKE